MSDSFVMKSVEDGSCNDLTEPLFFPIIIKSQVNWRRPSFDRIQLFNVGIYAAPCRIP
jgi:hypothetical protein